MFEAFHGASPDWDMVAGAVATFLVTAIATAFGFRKGLKRVQSDKVEQAHFAGATLMDNLSIVMLTEALKENTDLHRQIHSCLLEIRMILQLGLSKKD